MEKEENTKCPYCGFDFKNIPAQLQLYNCECGKTQVDITKNYIRIISEEIKKSAGYPSFLDALKDKKIYMKPYTEIKVIVVTEAEAESDMDRYLDLLCEHENSIVLQKDGSFSGLFYNIDERTGHKKSFVVSGKIGDSETP